MVCQKSKGRQNVAEKTVRLARGEVDLDAGLISFYALRRKDPLHQPLLKTVKYRFPKRKFIDRAGDLGKLMEPVNHNCSKGSDTWVKSTKPVRQGVAIARRQLTIESKAHSAKHIESCQLPNFSFTFSGKYGRSNRMLKNSPFTLRQAQGERGRC